MKISNDNVQAIAPKLEAAIQKVIEDAGLEEYQVDIVKLTPKAQMVPIFGSILHCRIIGRGHVVCTFSPE